MTNMTVIAIGLTTIGLIGAAASLASGSVFAKWPLKQIAREAEPRAFWAFTFAYGAVAVIGFGFVVGAILSL